MSLLKITAQNIEIHHLIPPHSTCLVAVSGGADSLALGHVLSQLSGRLSCRFIIATLDHMLRGAASAADAHFVADMAAAWGIPVIVGQVDVAALAQESKQGVETAARSARYTFLASAARAAGASLVATAHHADDQAETVLMHLVRGAGLHGLAGMMWSSPMPGASHLALIRPFLNLTRGQIDSYCRENDLHPRLDHTNLDSSLLRNRIRLEMLPALRQLNPQITRALMQLAEAASLDDQYLQQALEQAVANHLTYTSERIAVQRAVFQDLQPALQRRCIAWAARQLGAADVGYEPIVAAVSLALSGQVGSRALLGSGVSLRIDYDQVVIERKTAQRDKDDWPLLHLENAIEVDAPGVTTIPGLPWQLRASFSPLEADGRLTISTASRLWLRTRRPGDRFAPLGLHGHSQSVKEWMIDHKVPRAVRDQIPLLLVDDRIAALIVGEKWIVSEPFAAREDSQHILYLSFLHNET